MSFLASVLNNHFPALEHIENAVYLFFRTNYE